MSFQDRIKKVNKRLLEEARANRPAEPQEGEAPAPMQDLYESGRRERFEASRKSYPSGSSPRTTIALMAALERLAPAYRKASDDNDLLSRNGDKARARMVRDQYMQESFLPVIQALVDMYGIDEILNNRKALSKLDDMVMIEGGKASGYSESFIRSMYGDGRGVAPALSDGTVINKVRDITRLCENDQIRAAVGLANKIKTQIDNGEHSASPDDYELIQRVVLRGQ